FQSETVARPEATKFAADSPLEGDGFELLVPLQPNRVPPAARTRRARLRAIALRRSSTWVWPLAILADAAPHLSYEEGQSVGYVLLQGKSCGVSGTASLLDNRGRECAARLIAIGKPSLSAVSARRPLPTRFRPTPLSGRVPYLRLRVRNAASP